MATKQELAESLTVEQLREVASREDVDLSGLTAKQDIIEAVTSGVSKDTLERAADGQRKQGGAFASEKPATADPADVSAPDVPPDRSTNQTEADRLAAESPFDVGNQGKGTTDWSAPPATTATDRDPISAEDVDVPLADTELPALGPPNPEPRPATEAAPRNERGQITNDPVALQKAGQSPADLEVPGLGQSGPAIIVKQNPEVPSVHQIAGALSAVPGLPETRVTVHDAAGEEVPHSLGTDDRALIGSRANASLSSHPAHAQPGHWSNPNLRDMTDEERTADGEAYAERFGS